MKCQVLEHRLADILFMCEMLNGQRTWVDYLGTIKKYRKRTLGWLVNKIYSAVEIPLHLKKDLDEVCAIRNEIAHRYFKPRMNIMMTKVGCTKIVSELEEMYGKIENVINAFDYINTQKGRPLGYSESIIEKANRNYADYFNGLPKSEKEKIESWNANRN